MRDPNTNELDALDRLIAGGRAGSGLAAGGSETTALARIAFALGDAAGDDAGLNIERTWNRIAAGMSAAPASRRLGGRRPRLRGLFGGWRMPVRGGLSLAVSSIAALLVLTIAALFSVLVLPSGSAEASFLETVDRLAAASATALEDNAIDADEAAALQERVDAVVVALQDRPQELTDLPPSQARTALQTITAVRIELDRAALEQPAGPERAATAALVSASLARLDAVAAQVAAVVDASPDGAVDGGGTARPAADRDAGNDTGGSDPSGEGDGSDARANTADRDRSADDSADSDPADRPAVVDDRGGDAVDADRTDTLDTPLRPSDDAAGEPTRPATDVRGADAVRPAGTDTSADGAAGDADADGARDGSGTAVTDDTTPTDETSDRPPRRPPPDGADRPHRPPADAAPSEEVTPEEVLPEPAPPEVLPAPEEDPSLTPDRPSITGDADPAPTTDTAGRTDTAGTSTGALR